MDFKKKMKKFFTLTRKADGGFTLVELVVVIAILSILSGIAVPAYGSYVEQAKIATDKQTLATMNTAFTVACMDNEQYDMTALPFTPTASNLNTGVTVSHYTDDFQRYFGEGKFQYYDVVQYNKTKGAFVVNTVAAIKEALKEALTASNISDAEAMEIISNAFDTFSKYFSGNNPLFEDGFSIDGFIAQMPQEVQDAFGFGSNDVTEEQLEQLLCENVEGYATWSEEQKQKWKENEENQELLNTIKGNAYVMNLANAAGSGVTAEGIKGDIDELMDALTSASEMDDEQLWAEFQKNNPNSTYTSLEELKAACYNESLKNYGLTAGMLVAVAASGVENESGISTLCSMYAIAAGYLNSDEYEAAVSGGADKLEDSIGSFEEVIAVMNHSGFSEYYSGDGTTSDALNDIDAYLSYMNYVSANGVDMTSDSAFGVIGETILGILAGN